MQWLLILFLVFAVLKDILSKRIMIIDGAMGTEIQQFKLTSDDFRGKCNFIF